MENVKTAIAYSLFMMVLANSGPISAACPGDLNDTRYDGLRSEFLNVNPDLISDVDLNKVYTQSGDNGTAFINGSTEMAFRWNEGGTNLNLKPYGARYWCNNAIGRKSLCWLATGGDLANDDLPNNGVCGLQTGGDLAKANDPAYQCSTPNTQWAGSRFWLNAYDNDDYIIDAFKPPFANNDANQTPINRLCFEYELPPTGMDFSTNGSGGRIEENPGLATLVNPETVNDGYQGMTLSAGTYTCNRKNLAGARNI